jgi:hypothetical protein
MENNFNSYKEYDANINYRNESIICNLTFYRIHVWVARTISERWLWFIGIRIAYCIFSKASRKDFGSETKRLSFES